MCLNWVAGFMAYILMNQSRMSTPCMCRHSQLLRRGKEPEATGVCISNLLNPHYDRKR